MFNYFESNKIRQQNLKLTISKQKSSICKLKKKRNDEIMVKNYARRTNMLLYKQQEEQGTISAKYKDPLYEPRKTNTKLNIGPASFYYRDRSTQDRVSNAEKENEYLDNVPFNAHGSPTMHQFRNTSSCKPFKLTPFDTTSRVMENLKSMKTNVVPSSWNLNLSLYNNVHLTRNHQRKSTAARQILPSLNQRLHPKSYQSVQNNLLLGGLKNIRKCSQNQSNPQSMFKPNQMINAKTKKQSVKFQTFYVKTEQTHRKSIGFS